MKFEKQIRTICKATREIFFIILLLIIAFYLLFPFYWAFNSSLKSEAQLKMTPTTFIPRDVQTKNIAPTLKNYAVVLGNRDFLRSILNSFFVAGVTTFLSVLFGSFAGFALGKLRFRGKTPAGYAILAMTMFPQITILSGLYATMYNFGISSYIAMISSDLLFTLPLATWLMTSYFKQLPTEILESARVDGATFFQTFYLILMPLTAPAVVTTGLLTFIGTWNEYLFALTFTIVSPKARTVPVAIALFKGIEIHHVPFGEIMAGMVIVTIPIVVLALIFQRRIVAGLTAGAVKG